MSHTIAKPQTFDIDEAAAILTQHGYRFTWAPDALVVADPVQCSNGRRKWTEHRSATIRSTQDLFKFITARA